MVFKVAESRRVVPILAPKVACFTEGSDGNGDIAATSSSLETFVAAPRSPRTLLGRNRNPRSNAFAWRLFGDCRLSKTPLLK